MSEFKELKLSELVASSTNPRTEFEETSLNELAESIKAHGVLQPIIARIHPEDSKKYEVVCGERRFRASKLAKQKTIPVSIRELTDDEVFEIQIIENLERKDVHPMDEAIAFRRMLDSGKYSMEDIAAKVAKNMTFVAQRLKLNDLIPELKEDFLKGEFGVGHAIMFARIDEQRQKEFHESLGSYYSPGYGSIKSVQEHLDRKNADLDKALFPLDDATLISEVGACVSCMKCAAANPVLFPEADENFCYDTTCYGKKDLAFKIRELRRILDEKPETIVVKGWSFENDQILEIVESYGITALEYNVQYTEYGDQKNRVDAFNLKKFTFEGVFLKKGAKSNVDSDDPTVNIQEEICKIKDRASRALELDREKIYIRAIKEITKDEERNQKMLNSDPLELCEKKALALAILSYADDNWIKKEYGEEIGYMNRHEQLDKIFSDEFLNKLIRHHIQRNLISESIADFGKSDRPAYMHAIFSHYFPSEIELFTLEQTAIAEKRIKKSDSRIQVLQNEIDGKIDSVKRCASCKKSDEDKLEETGYPAMWKGAYCHSCSIKVQEA